MGLFDKKKKEQVEETKTLTLENTEVKPDSDNQQRYSVIVENVTTMLDGDGVIVTGRLTGKLSKNDYLYLYQPAAMPVRCTVAGMEAKLDDNRTSIVDEAEDTVVSLQLDIAEDIKIRKFAVLTNLGPQEKSSAKISAEDAALAALINGMPAFGKDNGYHATLAYWLSHAHLITPIKLDKEPQLNEKGVATISKDAKIGFYMLKSTAKLAGTPEGQDSMVLPLFTDWQSLRRWKGLAQDGAKVHTQIISFQQLYSMLKKGTVYAGIAINPFNPIPCTLPVPYLDTIVNTPGYKNEFGPKEGQGAVQEEKLRAGQKIMLGLPKENEENTAIREKLAEYGQTHEDVNSIAFLTKVEEETKNVRHLVVLDFTQEYSADDMKEHMEAIYQQLNPLAKEIKQVEFAIKGRITALDDVVSQHQDKMVVYSK